VLKLFVFSILSLFLGGWFSLWGSEDELKPPSILYLTWMHDPTTTMTVQWHTRESDPLSKVAYRKVGEREWGVKEGVYAKLQVADRLVHTVELDELEPDAEYQFYLVGRKGEHRFRTLPEFLTRPVKFVVGGDAYVDLSTLRRMNQQIAARSPDFVVVGGDIAYTIGRKVAFKGEGWELDRWRTFLKEWRSQMVTPEGLLIPILVVVGNHDIKATALNQREEHFLFYELFAMEEKGRSYRIFDAGNYLSLFLLDSGHSYTISGQQTQWLRETLSARENTPYKMAVYHIAGYPSVYPYLGSVPTEIRAQWAPLFERYHLNVAFEHHNHAYKRSHPIKADRIDPEGVVYMGDGSWGAAPRKPKKLWYLDCVARTNAVCLVTLNGEKSTVEAFSLQGKVIDSAMTLPSRSMVAWNERRLIQ
jgi:hypothetical protein